MTATTTDYTRTLGTVAPGGQVHLAHGIGAQRILCRFGAAKQVTTATLAVIPEDEGIDICDVLLAAEVKLSTLCKNCFSLPVRKRYQARLR